MTPEQFAAWLDGFLTGAGKALSAEQTALVAEKLATVRAAQPPLVFAPPVFIPSPIGVPHPITPWIPNPINPPWGLFEITCGPKITS